MATTKAAAGLNGVDTETLQGLIDEINRDHRNGIARFMVATHWKGSGPASETVVRRWELGGESHERGFTIDIDEPQQLLGAGAAPNPQEYLLAAMNACLLATYVAACAVNGIELESLVIESQGDIDLRGFLALDREVKPGYEQIDYVVRVKGSGTKEQFEQIHRHMQATSPNYFNMASAIRLAPTLIVE